MKKRIKKLLALAFVFIFTILPVTSGMAASTLDEQSLLDAGVFSSENVNDVDYMALLRANWETRGPGGRHDITIGYHNVNVNIYAKFTAKTWVQYRDVNWNLVWEGSYDPGITHRLMLGSNVYRISIYLPDDNFVIFQR